MANLTKVQQLGRAKNAISAFFDKRLEVPKIFIDADWDGNKVDVLAIDRAGVGDVSMISLLSDHFQVESDATAIAIDVLIDASLEEEFTKLLGRRSQFRYIARLANGVTKRNLSDLARAFHDFTEGFAADGIGRVGVLFVDASANSFEVHEVVKAERFRSTKEILLLTDNFVMNHTADMEYRDPVYEQEAVV